MSSTSYELHYQKRGILVNEFNFFTLKCSIRSRFREFVALVRNAGQLPQPFWLGAACGSGSCSAAPCAART